MINSEYIITYLEMGTSALNHFQDLSWVLLIAYY